MSISLKKGGNFNLSKNEPSLKKILIGLGWDFLNNSLDLDASVFVLGENGKLLADEYFVFYNNLKSPDGAIEHLGDNRTGMGDDDDEMVLINLDKVSPQATQILITVSIHAAEIKNHHFGLLSHAYIRLHDVDNKRVVLEYDLDENNPSNTIMDFGKLVRENNEWKFYALGNGSNKGLQGHIDIYA